MVHEFFRVRDRGVDKPDLKHEKEEDEEDKFPAPLRLEVFCGEVTMIEMVDEQEGKRDEGEVYGEPGQPAIP